MDEDIPNEENLRVRKGHTSRTESIKISFRNWEISRPLRTQEKGSQQRDDHQDETKPVARTHV